MHRGVGMLKGAPPPVVRWLVAAVCAGSGMLQILAQSQLGFPDGHVTEFEAAMRAPHLVFAAISIGVAVAMLWPGRLRRWWWIGLACAVLAADRLGLEVVGNLLGLDQGQGG